MTDVPEDNAISFWAKRPDGRGRNFSFQADLEPVTAHVASQYHAANGGSSFYVHGGGVPKRGYVIGGLPGVPEEIKQGLEMTPEEFQANRDRIRQARPTDTTAAAGSWAHKGKTYLDGSNAVWDIHAAKKLQQKRNQQAVYNLTEGRDEDLLGTKTEPHTGPWDQ